MKNFRLYKKEKLCSTIAIDQLFSPRAAKGSDENKSIMAYPWRAVWRRNPARSEQGQCMRFVITVPKKRLRHAVDRVRMRRLMREAYRLNRPLLGENGGCGVDIAFIYVANTLTPYSLTVKSITKIFHSISPNQPCAD